MNKSIYAIFFGLIALASVFVASPVSAETVNGGDDASAAVESTEASTITNGDDDTSSAQVALAAAAASSVTNGDDDAGGNTPGSGTNGATGGVTNGDDDAVGSSGPSTGTGSTPGGVTNGDDDFPAVSNGNNNGGGTTGGTTSSGGGSGSSSRNSNSSSVVSTVTTSCPLITDYLKFDGDNSALQVTKLQIFLNGAEKAGLTVNGIFDQKTEDAVKAFQTKYMTDILGPWDATRATGFVYITTMKKINALACATPIVLSAEEIAIIEAYKARGGSEQVGSEIGSATTTTGSTVAVTDETVGNDNVAAAANASILSRFWSFLKNLFQ